MAVWIDFSIGIHLARRSVIGLGPIMASFWLVTLSDDSPTSTPSSFRIGRGLPFEFGGDDWQCRLFSVTRIAAGCEVEACPGLERGLVRVRVRVRVRVTLDDGGHRYSQREQLMSDHSHDQLTVPNDLHDKLIGATASANSDGRHETDERIRNEDPLLATDRHSQHTHLQPVAVRGVWC